MNAPVLNFLPRVGSQPEANLAAFVALCRNSEVLGAKRQFDQNIWELGYLNKGQNKMVRVAFSTLEAATANKAEPHLPFPFLEFAKAMLVYCQDKRPRQSQHIRIMALRYMEAALRELGKGLRPTAVDEMALDSAVELAKNRMAPMVVYHIAGQLEYIANFMCSNRLLKIKPFCPCFAAWRGMSTRDGSGLLVFNDHDAGFFGGAWRRLLRGFAASCRRCR